MRRGPNVGRLKNFVCEQLGLRSYLRRPGDGRARPQIAARDLLWSLLAGQILRIWSFHGVEGLVRRAACRAIGVVRHFGDDALAYFTSDSTPLRRARR